ncbi:exodeoxyribonuclease V subunit alpha [Alteromonas ponticola]|uniref:RecBCD enzyme subunit RecD n=1 Tax=Alteromonas ponticola TaxID=2720613 RepID=A0ABX1R441_9ALTE|nr:exodeoxyribonuclease V subunit alpha [Alteromonas ponticola]NMH61202.1 exodeoxyribonuclease V subunit alpha [Alteromonas ponticola]
MKLIDSIMPVNPTPLKNGIAPIDWYTANLLSDALDVDDVSRRVWRHVVIMLSVAQRQGNTCLDLNAIAGATVRDCYQPEAEVHFPDTDHLIQLVDGICAKMSAPLVVLDGARLYTKRYWAFEQELAAAIRHRRTIQPLSPSQYETLGSVWSRLFPNQSATEDWQQVATAASLVLPFCIVNGGPGTGKTYTVARILLALQCAAQGKLNIQLAAPTGKAAQRLGESITTNITQLVGSDTDSVLTQLAKTIPTSAVTLHRLLGITPYQVKTKKNQDNPLCCDVLIVDEASMVDLALMVRTVRALKPECKLILVGDADQLPAIESGNVLEALVTAQSVTNLVNATLLTHIQALNGELDLANRLHADQPFTFTLQKSQRFGGALATTAQFVQAGEGQAAWQQLSELDAEQPLSSMQSHAVARMSPVLFTGNLTSMVNQCFAPLFSATSAKEALHASGICRWLTPVKKGPLGVERLNQQIEKIAWHRTAQLNLPKYGQLSRYFAGQPIMVLENNYANKLYNGDVGVVWPDDKGSLKAWFEGEDNALRAVSLSRLPAVQTAYVMTVHKSQGSEFSLVVMILPDKSDEQQFSLNCRELIYTGLTRAKQSCLFVCNLAEFVEAVQTRQQRFSGLGDYINKQIKITKENT